MRKIIIISAGVSALALGACAKKQVVVAPPPPLPQGAVVGSIAADRDGDGIIDGYYSADGIYHANYTPPPPSPSAPVYSPAVVKRGERG
jgi:hypothetical protein